MYLSDTMKCICKLKHEIIVNTYNCIYLKTDWTYTIPQVRNPILTNEFDLTSYKHKQDFILYFDFSI